MIELTVLDDLGRFLPFWNNFLRNAHNTNPRQIYDLAERIDNELRKYNGVRVRPWTNNLSKIEFKTEEDRTIFILRFA